MHNRAIAELQHSASPLMQVGCSGMNPFGDSQVGNDPALWAETVMDQDIFNAHGPPSD
jgi:hypothetical protein